MGEEFVKHIKKITRELKVLYGDTCVEDVHKIIHSKLKKTYSFNEPIPFKVSGFISHVADLFKTIFLDRIRSSTHKNTLLSLTYVFCAINMVGARLKQKGELAENSEKIYLNSLGEAQRALCNINCFRKYFEDKSILLEVKHTFNSRHKVFLKLIDKLAVTTKLDYAFILKMCNKEMTSEEYNKLSRGMLSWPYFLKKAG